MTATMSKVIHMRIIEYIDEKRGDTECTAVSLADANPTRGIVGIVQRQDDG